MVNMDDVARMGGLKPAGERVYHTKPTCVVCHKTKAPAGRSIPAPAVGSYCTFECDGYYQEPYVNEKWFDGEEVL